MSQHDRGSGGQELSLDACLELLANRQRRRILEVFDDGDLDHASIDELIAEIIEAEIGATGERPGHDTVASTLFHVHLPKFAEAGVLEYDSRNLEVRYRGDPKIEELFETIQQYE